MKTVIKIFEELEATNSRLEKEAILEFNAKNSLLKKAFIAALDPYVVYYVNKFKVPKSVGKYDQNFGGSDLLIERFITLILPKLSNRNVTGNAAKLLVEHEFASMNNLEQKWCQRILIKNLRCGVQGSTVNKIWPDTIKGFDVSLAETLKTSHSKNGGIKVDEQVSYPVRVEPKLDGLRCIAVKQSGVVTMYTRNGSILETLPRIKSVLESAAYDNLVLDGEGIGSTWNDSASVIMSHKEKKDDSGITFNVFDSVLLDDWKEQSNDEKFDLRLNRTKKVVETINLVKDGSSVKHVDGKTVISETELLKFYVEMMNLGYEGIMLKDMNAPYKFKRSSSILKMKPTQTWEGVIVGCYNGRRGTKREGLFGGFYVMLPNKKITRAGGGFSDKDKALIQLSPLSYVGKIVEIEGQPDPSTTDGLTEKGKVRFPVFLRYRDPSDVDPKVVAIKDVDQTLINQLIDELERDEVE